MHFAEFDLMAERLLSSIKVFLARFGEVMGRLVLGVVYFAMLGPVAVFVRLLSDPLRRRRPKDSAFLPRESVRDLQRDAGRQG